MNEVAKKAAAELLQAEPELGRVLDEFTSYQEELDQLLDVMGVRHVMIEVPPKGNADAVLHANVSSTRR